MKRLFFFCAILLLPSLYADTPLRSPPAKGYRYAHSPTPADRKKWATCGHPEGGAEALLWRVAGPGFGYVRSNESGISTIISDKPGYDWGIRAYTGYLFPNCWDIRVSYLFFEPRFADDRTSTTPPPALTPMFAGALAPPNQAFASANVKERFQAIDADLGTTLYCGCQAQFKAFGGARWVDQCGREQYRYINFVDAETTATQRTRFWGVGPRFGLYSSFWPIPCGILQSFSVDGCVATSGIIAHRSWRFQQTENFFFTGENTARQPATTLIVPAFDVRVGVNFCVDWGCLTWTAYAAYELQWYQNAQARVVSTANGFGYPNPQVSGIGYTGWSFGIKGRF